MSETAIHPGRGGQSAFDPRSMLVITAIGMLAFVAMLVLGAYAPDLRSGRNGGAHALSNAATGFSGLVRLAEATGRNPRIVRSENELRSEELAVVTPDHGSTDLAKILEQRGPRATLIVLPKWQSTADKAKGGWVRVAGLLPADDPAATLAPSLPLKVQRHKTTGAPLRTLHPAAPPEMRFAAPRAMQTIAATRVAAIVTDDSGRIVLGQVGSSPLYILADPDLINNHGLKNEAQARAALAMLDFLNGTGAKSILFDVTANGLGRSRSPLKLVFDPPFLGVTLTLFAAVLLAAIQALVRFGAPQPLPRALPFGKAALVFNSAALIRKAGREARLGPRFVEVVREHAATLFRLPPTLSPDVLDERLEALNPRRSFIALAATAGQARSRTEMLGAAIALHQWLEEVQ